MSGDWATDFGAWLRASGRSQRTVRAYLLDVQVFARWFEGREGERFEPQAVTGVDLQDFRRWSLDEGRVSAATWNRRRAAMRVFCAWALEAGLLAYDPSVGLAKAQAVASAPKWLTMAEARRVLRALERRVQVAKAMGMGREYRRAVRDRAALLLMMKAGLRVGEVTRLRWDDMELRPRSGEAMVRGKGRKRRRVPLTADVRAALAQWREVSDKGEGEVFGVSTHQLGVVVREVGREAGLERRLTPHMLRHTFAKALVDAGRPLTEVQQLLGHSRLDVTAVYVRPSWEDLGAAVAEVWG